MNLRPLSPLLLLATIAAIAGCDPDDGVGTSASASDSDTATSGVDTDPGDTTGDSGDTTGDSDTDPGTSGESGDSGDGLECPTSEVILGYSDADPSGQTAKDLFGIVETHSAGSLVYEGGAATALALEVYYDGGLIHAIYGDGLTPGCEASSVLYVEAQMTIASDDGLFQDTVPVTLARSSASPDEIDFSAADIDISAMTGHYEAPAAIGPEGYAPADFASLVLHVSGVFGAPRLMYGPLDLELGEVNGVILGQGELSEWSCSEVPGEGCMGSLRDFYVGAFTFGG